MVEFYVPILLGSIRTGRQSVKVARFILGKMQENDRVHTELLDLAEYDFPILQERPDQMDSLPTGLREFTEKLGRADGVLIVAPEYKNSYPGVLKNALDYLKAGAFQHKPIAICTVSAGGFGGLHCLTQLRLVCLALGGVPIPEIFPVSRVREAFDEKGIVQDPGLEERLEPFLAELLWHTEAMTNQREKSGPDR